MVKRCGPQGLNVRAHQRRGDAAAEVTPVRCKAKQKALARKRLNPARRVFGLAAVAGRKRCDHASSNRRSREMTISAGERYRIRLTGLLFTLICLIHHKGTKISQRDMEGTALAGR